MPGNGAYTTAFVQFDKPFTRITRVQAVGYVPGTGYGPAYTLDAAGAGVYQGECRIPVNRSRFSVQSTVLFIVTTADGGQVRRTVGLKVLPWTDVLPPPPPAQ